MSSSVVTASDWIKGIGLSITASIIGGASKLAIRKSWVMVKGVPCPCETTASSARQSSEQDQQQDQAPFHPSFHSTETTSSQNVQNEQTNQEEIHLSELSLNNIASSPSSTLVKSHGGRGKTPPPGARRRTSPTVSAGVEMTSIGTSVQSYTYDNNSHKLAVDAARRTLITDYEYTSSTCVELICPPSPSNTPLIKRVTQVSPSSISSSSSLHRQSKMLRYSGMFGMTVLNPICCVWAMEYASPSILAPFSGLTLVWIILFSDRIIGERPQYMQVVAAGWIIAGEVIVAIFGDHTNETGSISSVQDVYKEYLSTGSIVYSVCLTVWMIWIASVIRQPMSMSGQRVHPNLVRFAWGVAGGSITGLQNFLKDALTLLNNYTSSKEEKEESSSLPPIFFVFALCAVASSLCGLLLLTACMKRYDATYSSSMFVGSFVLSASLMAAVRYHTFQNLDTIWNYIFYPTGLVVLLIGIYILATISEEREQDKGGESRKTIYGTDRFSSMDSRITEDSSVSTTKGLLDNHHSIV